MTVSAGGYNDYTFRSNGPGIGSANGNRTRTAPPNHSSPSRISLIPRSPHAAQYWKDQAKTALDDYTWLHDRLNFPRPTSEAK